MFHPPSPVLLAPVAILCSAFVLLIAVVNDIAARTLPNWTALAVLVIGIFLRLADWTLPLSLAVGALVFGLALICWRRGLLGGGDVKLLAACTLLVPPDQVFILVLATAMFGGALAVIYLLLRRLDPGRWRGRGARPAGMAGRIWRVECWRISRRGSLPYGCAIAAAAMFMLLAART